MKPKAHSQATITPQAQTILQLLLALLLALVTARAFAELIAIDERRADDYERATNTNPEHRR